MRHASTDTSGSMVGFILGGGAILGVVVIALHPHAASSGPNLAEMVSGSPRLSAANAIVHGLMIALIYSWISALSILATRLGENRLWVRHGLIAYVLGGLLAIGAGLINGFVVPEAAELYRGQTGVGIPGDIGTLLWAMTQVLTKCGIIAMSAGIAFLSVGLLTSEDKMARVTGGAGILIGGAIAVAMLAGELGASLLGMAVAVAAQGLWYLLISALLITRRI